MRSKQKPAQVFKGAGIARIVIIAQGALYSVFEQQLPENMIKPQGCARQDDTAGHVEGHYGQDCCRRDDR